MCISISPPASALTRRLHYAFIARAKLQPAQSRHFEAKINSVQLVQDAPEEPHRAGWMKRRCGEPQVRLPTSPPSITHSAAVSGP